MYEWIKRHKIQLILVIAIPIVTIGFNFFESTHSYQRIIGVDAVSEVVNEGLLGINFTGGPQYHQIFPANPYFQEIWKLIKDNTNQPFPNGQTPEFIGILSPHAHDYVDVWNGATSTVQVLLIPNSVPVAVGFCSLDGVPKCIQNKNIFIIGSAQEIKDWAQSKKDSYRTKIDSTIAMISIIAAILSMAFEDKNKYKVSQSLLDSSRAQNDRKDS